MARVDILREKLQKTSSFSKLIDTKRIVEVMEKSWLIRNNQDLIMERLIREWGNLKGFSHSLLLLINLNYQYKTVLLTVK